MKDMRPPHAGTKMKDGRWRTFRQVTGPNGLPYSKRFTSFKGETKAKFFARVEQEAASQEAKAPTPTMTLKHGLDLWIERKEKSLKPNTIRNYKDGIRHLKPLHHVRLSNLTSSYTIDHALEGIPHDRSRKLARDVLIRACKWFVKNKWMPENTAAQSDPVSYSPAISKQISAQNARTAISKARTPVWAAIFYTLMFTGLRPAEVVNLTWPEIVNAEDGWWIKLSDSKTEMGKEPIPIPGELREILEKLPRSSVFVFPSHRGKPYVVTTVNHEWKELQELADLTPVNVYALRKLYGRTMAKVVQKHVLRRLMRHTDIRTTEQFYLDAEMEEMRKAVDGK